jgi:hypothetical protein
MIVTDNSSNNDDTNHNQTQQTATLAIVGDSLSFEQYYSLVQSLGVASSSILADGIGSFKKTNDIVHWLPCENNSEWKLVFRRTDHLEDLPQTLQDNQPHIIVLNRGAHYTPNELFIPQFQATIAHLRSWQRNCRSSGRRCLLFYRTTVPGHPQCSKFNKKGPSDSIFDMEAWIGNPSNYYGDYEWRNQWWRFKFQNELALTALLDSSLQFQVLDAYDINILRPDLHRGKDCLHSCFPGKMDVCNRMLLHYMKASVY